jgi:peptidoglycan/LPS O-acetylase OafA/YrhL
MINTSTTSGVQAARRHLDFLDGIRGLAAVYVVFHHAMLSLPQPFGTTTLERLLRKAGGFGHYSVDIFIVLSGYCLMLPQLKRNELDVVQFLERRALRILPSYYLAGALALLLIHTVIGAKSGTHWDLAIPVTSRDLVTHLFLVHDWFVESAAKINHVFWSIGVEWKIYFTFPLLLLVRRRIGAAKMAIMALVVSYAVWGACALTQSLNPGPWGSSFYYIGLFALGMLAAEWAEQDCLPQWLNSRSRVLTTLSILTLGVAAVAALSHGRLLQLQSGIVGLWTALLLIALRKQALPRYARTPFTNRLSLWLGRQGYSIYLIHAPVLQIVYWYGVRHVESTLWRTLLMVGVGMGATLMLVPLFFAIAERPFHLLSQRVPSRLDKRRAERAVSSTAEAREPAVLKLGSS